MDPLSPELDLLELPQPLLFQVFPSSYAVTSDHHLIAPHECSLTLLTPVVGAACSLPAQRFEEQLHPGLLPILEAESSVRVCVQALH